MEDAGNVSLYPPSIVEWELRHGIVREIRNGVMYVRCTNFDAFIRQTEEEKAAERRAALNRRIGEAQEKAYLGEVA